MLEDDYNATSSYTIAANAMVAVLIDLLRSPRRRRTASPSLSERL
jgi:hypothetical protein